MSISESVLQVFCQFGMAMVVAATTILSATVILLAQNRARYRKRIKNDFSISVVCGLIAVVCVCAWHVFVIDVDKGYEATLLIIVAWGAFALQLVLFFLSICAAGIIFEGGIKMKRLITEKALVVIVIVGTSICSWHEPRIVGPIILAMALFGAYIAAKKFDVFRL